MTQHVLTMSLAAVFAGCLGTACGAGETVIIPLDGKTLPGEAMPRNAQAEPTVQDGRPALRVTFGKFPWPNIYFHPKEGAWDWSKSGGIVLDVYNPEKEPVPFSVRVDNEGADGANHCNGGSGVALPGKWTTMSMRFKSGAPERLWGMRGIPGAGPLASGSTIDLTRITGFQVFLARPDAEHTLVIANVRLIGGAADAVPLPFVDRFGQYKHAHWPGKLKSERELEQRRDREESALAAASAPNGLDRYGGWAGGPQLEATGWFRTQKLDGKWWLVDPDGHLFFSVGVDCIRTHVVTFTEGRNDWFEWLPDDEGEFKPTIGYVSGVHSMADPIGGKGRTCSFYRVNLIRKCGSDWHDRWREAAYARLKSWGYNTIGNWSPEAIPTDKLPYVATVGITGDFRPIGGGGGYWRQMPDVFDPKFAAAAAACIAPAAKQFASDRYRIGWFVDNELAWEAIERGTLASPPDQPCRMEMVRRLKKQYGGLDGLNSAWDTNASSWDDLRVPESPNEVCRKDLDGWVYAFSRRYFDTVKGVLRRYAPRQLYLGCRFAWSHKQAIRAAADVADVVSFNLYRRSIDCADWTGDNDLGKPLIIGEFHFGALDHGMFHPGLVPTADQEDRAASYIRYVESVIDCPAFVGCHWFQYVDEPITGRTWDGENYNIGLVDVTDTPYPELTAAAKKVNSEIYSRRYGGN